MFSSELPGRALHSPSSQWLPAQCGYLAMRNARYTPRKTIARPRSFHRTAFRKKNGLLAAAGSAKTQRALAEIDQRQCRHHEGEPIDPDRVAPEMAHVGKQGFSAREPGTNNAVQASACSRYATA